MAVHETNYFWILNEFQTILFGVNFEFPTGFVFWFWRYLWRCNIFDGFLLLYTHFPASHEDPFRPGVFQLSVIFGELSEFEFGVTNVVLPCEV